MKEKNHFKTGKKKRFSKALSFLTAFALAFTSVPGNFLGVETVEEASAASDNTSALVYVDDDYYDVSNKTDLTYKASFTGTPGNYDYNAEEGSEFARYFIASFRSNESDEDKNDAWVQFMKAYYTYKYGNNKTFRSFVTDSSDYPYQVTFKLVTNYYGSKDGNKELIKTSSEEETYRTDSKDELGKNGTNNRFYAVIPGYDKNFSNEYDYYFEDYRVEFVKGVIYTNENRKNYDDPFTSEITITQEDIKNTEKLDKIKIIGDAQNTSYSVKVVGENTTKTLTKSVVEPGLITFDFDSQNINVNANSKIIVTGDNDSMFFDRIYVFTDNIDNSALVDLNDYDKNVISGANTRFYSKTRNIPSGANVTYKLYDYNGNEVTSGFNALNNVVAENNINTLLSFTGLTAGVYRIDAIYGGNVISSSTISYPESYYVVSYNANGGEGTMNKTLATTNESTQLLKNKFTKKGYIIDHWNTKPDDSGTSYQITETNPGTITSDKVAEEITLYAIWKIDNTRTLLYNTNGGEGYRTPTKVPEGTTVTVIENTFRRTGYRFNSWNTKQDGTGTPYNPGDELTVTSDMTLYAIWDYVGTYSVYYDRNGGDGTLYVTNITIGETGEVAYNSFEKTHYIFVHWNTSADGTGTSYNPGDDITPTSDMTLYAIWQEIIPRVAYKVHVQKEGWQGWKYDGAMSGTSGKGLRLEAINIELENNSYTGGIEYRTHIQTYGWETTYKKNGEMSGTSGQGKRLEAIQIRLTGQIAEHYDVYYRVHAQSFGWLDWAKNDGMAGTAGYAYRLEAIEIRLVKKGEAAPGETKNAYKHPMVSYNTHVQRVGWQGYVRDGLTAGTSGQGLRLEGIHIKLENQEYEGSIKYSTHVQRIGWQDYVYDNAMSGTSGQGLRLEAIKIDLTGEMKEHYDIYYRVHAQKFGWLDWASNGEPAGTAGYAYRLEAIQIVIVEKGDPAPGSTTRAFIQK